MCFSSRHSLHCVATRRIQRDGILSVVLHGESSLRFFILTKYFECYIIFHNMGPFVLSMHLFSYLNKAKTLLVYLITIAMCSERFLSLRKASVAY